MYHEEEELGPYYLIMWEIVNSIINFMVIINSKNYIFYRAVESGDSESGQTSELTYVCEANKVFRSTGNYIVTLCHLTPLSLYRGFAELNHKYRYGVVWGYSRYTQGTKVSI